MAITSSAKKAIRVSEKKRVFNLRRKNEIEKRLKEFRKLIFIKNKTAAQKMISGLYKALDKAVKTDYLKTNTSSRLKSRAMAALNKLV